MPREVRRWDAACRADFFRIHCAEKDTGWCHCIAWWVPTWDGWGDRTAEDNRRLRDDLCDRGVYDAYLLYVDGTPAGSCQVGPRDRLAKLAAQYRLDPDPSAWAITCFLILPEFRRKGHAGFLLRETLDDLCNRRGVRRVEAFPRRGADLDAGGLWTGPEALYRAAGFAVVRDDPSRPVLALTGPRAGGADAVR